MTEQQHTPGPWKVCRASIFTRFYVKAVHATYVVAECGICEGKTGEANARLIAAAPDLLAALRSARECLASAISANVDLPGFDVREHRVIKKIDTAIAAAEGR